MAEISTGSTRTVAARGWTFAVRSDSDIARLRRIGTLIAEGINLTGIGRVLGLEADNANLHADNAGLRARNAHLRTTNTVLRGTSTTTAEQT